LTSSPFPGVPLLKIFPCVGLPATLPRITLSPAPAFRPPFSLGPSRLVRQFLTLPGCNGASCFPPPSLAPSAPNLVRLRGTLPLGRLSISPFDFARFQTNFFSCFPSIMCLFPFFPEARFPLRTPKNPFFVLSPVLFLSWLIFTPDAIRIRLRPGPQSFFRSRLSFYSSDVTSSEKAFPQRSRR